MSILLEAVFFLRPKVEKKNFATECPQHFDQKECSEFLGVYERVDAQHQDGLPGF